MNVTHELHRGKNFFTGTDLIGIQFDFHFLTYSLMCTISVSTSHRVTISVVTKETGLSEHRSSITWITPIHPSGKFIGQRLIRINRHETFPLIYLSILGRNKLCDSTDDCCIRISSSLTWRNWASTIPFRQVRNTPGIARGEHENRYT